MAILLVTKFKRKHYGGFVFYGNIFWQPLKCNKKLSNQNQMVRIIQQRDKGCYCCTGGWGEGVLNGHNTMSGSSYGIPEKKILTRKVFLMERS